jgi:flagellar protein FlgJ
MTIELNGVARLAGAATSVAAPAGASTATNAGQFATTVRRADEIASFETVVKRAAAESASGADRPSQPPASSPAAAPAPAMTKKADKAKKSFEAFALQVFIGSMLPKENSKLFGTGSAGKMWQAMLAEKLADQIAASGRLKLLPDQPAGTATPPAVASGGKEVVPVQGGVPADGSRPAATAGATAALETLAMGLKPSRGGGIK